MEIILKNIYKEIKTIAVLEVHQKKTDHLIKFQKNFKKEDIKLFPLIRIIVKFWEKKFIRIWTK